MKAKITRILLALFAIFWASQVSFAQIITTAPNISGCPGTQISVPVTVDNFDAVASLSITLNINPAVITYVSYTSNPGMAGGFLVVNSAAPYTQVKAAWFGLNPLTLANGSVLFTFTFNYLQGSCPLIWDLATSGNCQYSDLPGNTLPSTWIDGSVSTTSPLFTTQPVDIAVNESSSASFSVSATDADSYQWQESANGGSTWNNTTDGPDYTGSSTTDLTITNATLAMNGYQYRCNATSAICNVTTSSNSANLTVNSATSDIIAQIGTIAACQGGNISVPVNVSNFNSVASMTVLINYNQGALVFNNFNYNAAFGGTVNASASAGVITITYSGPEVNIGTGTAFDLGFTYNGGTAGLDFNTAQSSFLDGNGTIIPATFVNGGVTASSTVPSITVNPIAQVINENGNATFQITATGADTYQWQVGATNAGPWVDIQNGAPYSGATSNTLTITNTPLSLSLQYYRCVATESTCSLNAASGSAMLTVIPSTTDIITTIGSISACPGYYITIPITVMNFNDVASASMKITYDTLSLTYDSVNSVNSNLASGFSMFNAANGQVGMAWFAILPATFGSGLLFNIVFHHDANASPLSFDPGLGICQYTDINFNLLPAIWIDGSVSIPGPVINTMPTNQTAFSGTNAIFTLTGTNITSYQWQRNIGGLWTDLTDGTDYTGTTTASLTVNNVNISMDGYIFRCAVDGSCGIQYSYTVSLMVINSNPIVTTLPTITQCQGPVTVPINVTNFDNVGSFSLTFNTSGNVLSYNGFQGANINLPGLTVTNTTNNITIAWTGTSPVTLGTATLVTIKFNSLPGTTPLQWDPISFFKSISNTNLPHTLNPGNATINAFPGAPSAITGPNTVCQNSGTSSYATTGAANASSYQWAVIPSNAGSIAGTGLTAVVTWDAAFTGLATITVKGVNSCGPGPIMSKATTIVAVPVVTFDTLTPACSGQDTIPLTGGLPTGGTYTGTGVVNNEFIPILAGVGSHIITYTLSISGCSASATQTQIVYATPTPTFTLPAAQADVCYYWPAFNLTGGAPLGGTYSGVGVTSNTGVFTPAQAIIGDRVVTYSVSTNNCTGTASDIVHVDPCTGIPESQTLSISVQPNPNTGIFSINIQNVNEAFELGLYNNLGQKVFEESILPQNNEFKKNVDLSSQPKGLYFLKLSGKDGVRIEKIVLN